MAGREEPAVLPIGTEVSAKYKGAFCEAKVKKVVKLVKCKVTVNESNAHHVVTDEDIRGPIKVGAMVEVKPTGAAQSVLATINKVNDHSTYTVVFDDGDENILRRTQLCLKGEKHFVKSETLDDLPLSHPEHFGTPVMKAGKRRRRRNTGSDFDSDSGTSGDDSEEPAGYQSQVLQDLMGRIVCMEVEDRKRTSLLTPVLVVQPSADLSTDLSAPDTMLVKSFKDTKFYPLMKKNSKEFTRRLAIDNEDKALKLAYEKALLYYDTGELPSHWDKEELLGIDGDSSSPSDSSDDEPSEEKDRFVAQLYKFMDERNTPINKGPMIGTRDLHLHKLFKLVRNLGGYNRVTNQMKWPVVHHKMGLQPSSNSSNQLKTAYKKYLHAFEDFDRKLGSTMGTMSRPGRSRHGSRRSIMSYRDREDSMPKSPRGTRRKDDDDDAKSACGESSKSIGRGRVTPADGEKNLTPTRTYDSETESESSRKSRTSDKRSRKDEVEDEKVRKQEGGLSKVSTRVGGVKGVSDDNLGSRATPPTKDDSRLCKKDEDRKTRGASRDIDDSLSEREEREEGKKKSMKMGRKSIPSEEGEESHKMRRAILPPHDCDLNADSDDSEDDRREVRTRAREKEDVFNIGTKLKVKYGKGKTQKIYEAKILEVDLEGAGVTYLVHYAGWNHRYNEWIRRDRIISVVEEGPAVPITPPMKISSEETAKSTGKSTPPQQQMGPKISTAGAVKQGKPAGGPPGATAHAAPPIVAKTKPVVQNPAKKRGRPAGSSNVNKESTERVREPKTPPITTKKAASPTPPPPPPPQPPPPPSSSLTPDPKSHKPTPASVTVAAEARAVKVPVGMGAADVKSAKVTPGGCELKPPRPTRSTSVENTLAPGLPTANVRRMRRGSGVQESNDTPDDESDSESSSDEGSDDEEEVRTTRSAAQRAKAEGSTHDLMAASRSHPDASLIAESTLQPRDMALHMKDMTQMIRDSNRARELSSKVKEVAKFREVASKLKEVASKVKEVNTKVKEVESKIKEEVTKEEQSAKKKEAAGIEKRAKEEATSEENIVASYDERSSLPPEISRKEADEEKQEPLPKSKNIKKRDVVKEKKSETVQLSQGSSKSADATTMDTDSDRVEGSLSRSSGFELDSISKPDTALSRDCSQEKSQRQQGKTSMASEKSRSDTEIKDTKEVKRRGPKSKRPLDTAEEKQTDSETEAAKPKRKRPKKKEREEEKKKAVPDGGSDKPTVSEPQDKFAFIREEREESEQTPGSSKALNISDSSITSPTSSSTAPELLSVTSLPTGSAGERSDGDQPLPPQLSPQMPGSSMVAVRDQADNSTSGKPERPVISPPCVAVQSPPRAESPDLIQSCILFDNTPPDTPVGSPVPAPPVGMSPSQEDSSSSTGSSEERQANMEVESFMTSVIPSGQTGGSDSPGLCDTSTISNGSGGSSGNAPSSESEEVAPANASTVVGGIKRKSASADDDDEEDEEEDETSTRKSPIQKRRKRSHKRNQNDKPSKKSTPKHNNMSDSDDGGNQASKVPSIIEPQRATSISTNPPPPRSCKYNFLDLSEGQYLEGEERIQYLMRRIQDLRKIYMQLKAEVACIDRRRKRHKRKEREAAHAAAAAAAAQAAVDAVVNQPRVDMSSEHH